MSESHLILEQFVSVTDHVDIRSITSSAQQVLILLKSRHNVLFSPLPPPFTSSQNYTLQTRPHS